MAKLTIKRFAREIGLSVGTVSAALNGRPSVRATTAEYVREMAAKLGFVANPWAKKMQGSASRLFGIVLQRNPTNLANALSRMLSDVLRSGGYTSVVLYTEDREEIDLFRAPVDGYVFVSHQFPRLRAALDERAIPVLGVDQGAPYGGPLEAVPSPSLELDRDAGGVRAAELLIQAGCAVFAYGGEPRGAKYEGFVEELTRRGCSNPQVAWNPEVRLIDRDSVARLLGSAKGPVGVWLAGLRELGSFVRACDLCSVRADEAFHLFYWGTEFTEIPGLDRFSFIGRPDSSLATTLLEWARAPRDQLESSFVQMLPVIRMRTDSETR